MKDTTRPTRYTSITEDATHMTNKVTYEVAKIDGELAEAFLANNLSNRSISPTTVSTYARDMKEGRWRFTGAPISFDAEGNLLDGQHRLKALIMSGTSHDFLVVRNLDAAARQAIDIGRRRSVADSLTMDQIRNGAQVASAARLILRWRTGHLRTGRTWRPSDAEIRGFVMENEGTLQDSASFAQKIRRVLPVSQSAVTAAHHETTRVDPGNAAIFWAKVLTGADLPTGDPALSFRNAIVRIGAKHEDRSLLNLELAVRAWRYHVAGRTTGQTFLRKNLSQIREHDFQIEDGVDEDDA